MKDDNFTKYEEMKDEDCEILRKIQSIFAVHRVEDVHRFWKKHVIPLNPEDEIEFKQCF